jgi:hypothetical protein
LINSTYYIHEILTPLLDWENTQFGQAHQNFVIHADNARPHIAKVVLDFCEENGITLAPHPPYSPDLAPSDFYLFGFLKDKLKGCVYDEPGKLLGAIGAILEDVDPATLERVFRHWIKKLEDCISGNGEYTSSSKIIVHIRILFILEMSRNSHLMGHPLKLSVLCLTFSKPLSVLSVVFHFQHLIDSIGADGLSQ